MKNIIMSVIFVATLFISSGCTSEVITDPCHPDFIGPPEAGQCE